MRIFRTLPGEISKEAQWICTYDLYMHMHKNFFGLIWNVLLEYKNDKHLAG